MEVPSCRLYLDMLAYHIEAQFFSLDDVVSQCFVCRGCVESVRPPALVERAELEQRFSVQCHSLVVVRVSDHGNFPHCRIAFHPVQNLAATNY